MDLFTSLGVGPVELILLMVIVVSSVSWVGLRRIGRETDLPGAPVVKPQRDPVSMLVGGAIMVGSLVALAYLLGYLG